MKKMILISGLFLASTSFAAQLHNYTEMTAAIAGGKSLRFVTNFTQCSTTQVNAAAAATVMSIASVTPAEIGVTDAHIAMAFTHFTMFDPMFPGKPVTEYVRYTITPDGYMTANLYVLDPTTYASLMNPLTFLCKMDDATKVYA